MYTNLFKKNKSELAKHHFFKKYYKHVYSSIYMIIKDIHLAEDITQETFIKAFKQMYTLRDQRKIRSWLGSIATRTSIDYLRDINIKNETVMENSDIEIQFTKKHSNQLSVEKTVLFNTMISDIYIEMDNLKPKYKEILIFKYLYDMKDKEIARKTNTKIGTVKSRLHRAKKELAKRLEESELG